jgi:hypothetical protein
MVQRRDLLRTSLTICGCAICGGFGIGASGGDARADGATATSGKGYELWFIGAQRETIMNGKLAAALDLNTLANRTHIYGLGPLEQLRGEVTIADGRPRCDGYPANPMRSAKRLRGLRRRRTRSSSDQVV